MESDRNRWNHLAEEKTKNKDHKAQADCKNGTLQRGEKQKNLNGQTLGQLSRNKKTLKNKEAETQAHQKERKKKQVDKNSHFKG